MNYFGYFDPFNFDLFDELKGIHHASNLRELDMKTDILQKKDCIIIKMELPGIDKKDITLNIEKNKLIVTCESKKSDDFKESELTYSERSYGSYRRSIPLPEDIDSNEIKAQMENGILTITISKAAKLKKSIEIK